MTAEELLEQYEKGERDFSGVDLTKASLEECRLNGINFSQAILRQVSMAFVELVNVNLEGADLTDIEVFDVSWRECNLQSANLERAILVESTLEDINLTKANLRFSCWGDTTHLINADLREAIWQDISDYPLRRNTIMPDGEVVTDEIELPDGSKIIP
ncbi:MAG: pentapeptide repeat-containing protein [Rivularia sp. (in: Bacteria)]|nr:pentapeptide repeat-containing protein [Rivularia sp. MS3]